MTPEAFQANTAMDVWIEGLTRFRDDEDRLAVFQLEPGSATDLVNEMIHGFSRTGGQDRIMDQLKAISYGLTVDKQAPPAAIVCSERINSFVSTLGARDVPERERPVIEMGDGTTREPFEPRLGADSAEGLPVEQRAAASELWTDWVFSLDSLFVGNAKDGDAGTINIEQTLKIGKVITGLGQNAE
jgi:hypothetical protein